MLYDNYALCIMNYALKKAPRSGMNNRRVAGAVVLPAFRIHYVQTKSTGDCRPGDEALIVFSVYSVYSVVSSASASCAPVVACKRL